MKNVLRWSLAFRAWRVMQYKYAGMTVSLSLASPTTDSRTDRVSYIGYLETFIHAGEINEIRGIVIPYK